MPRLGTFGEIKISTVNETTIGFAGMNESGDGVSGSIDRVTGDLEANSVVGNWTISYSLKCKPTQRMF
jgi:hypothetical protein